MESQPRFFFRGDDYTFEESLQLRLKLIEALENIDFQLGTREEKLKTMATDEYLDWVKRAKSSKKSTANALRRLKAWMAAQQQGKIALQFEEAQRRRQKHKDMRKQVLGYSQTDYEQILIDSYTVLKELHYACRHHMPDYMVETMDRLGYFIQQTTVVGRLDGVDGIGMRSYASWNKSSGNPMPRSEDRDREPCAACQRREDRKAMVARDGLWYCDTCAEAERDGKTKERR